MERWRNKLAVVTGASSGIGAAIALELVKQGMIVIAIARRVDKIKEMKILAEGPGELHPYKADVSSEEEINGAFDYVREKFKTVHVLVNNAGIGRPGLIAKQDPKHMRDVLAVNVMGVTICTQRALALMKDSGVVDGHIINMNSVLGHKLDYFTDATAMYGPSKFAVTALTEVIRRELRNAKKKIKITSISPGQVDTEILDSSTLAVGLPNNIEKDKIPTLNATDVADAVVYVLSTPPRVQVHEIIIKHIDEQY